jgi:signal transduction histidine kinase/ABC-type nitrate/sulfonate/bicarbonate transport system substrate-binding protein/CheY-like chemotaxis protein
VESIFLQIIKLVKFCLTFLLIGVVQNPLVAQSAFPKEKISIQFKWFHKFQFAGYYIAKEKGFYAEEGLEVTLLERDPKIPTLQTLREGKAQFAVSDSNVILDFVKGEKFVVLAGIFQHSPLVLVTLRKSGINTPPELIGKKVSFGFDDRAPIISMFTEAGVKQDSYEYVSNAFFDIDNLINGKVDAISSYLTNQPFFFRKKNVEINIINPLNYGVDLYGDLLVTTDSFIKENPDRTEKMIRATLRGWDYAMKNKKETIDLILAKYNPGLDRDALAFEADQMDKFINLDVVELGHVSLSRFERIAKIYSSLKLIEPNYNLDGLVYEKERYKVQNNKYFYYSVLAIFSLFVYGFWVVLRKQQSQAKKALREIDERVVQLGKNLKSGAIFQMVTDGKERPKIRYISQGIQNLLGIDSEVVLQNNKVFYDFILEEDYFTFIDSILNSASKGQSLEMDIRFRSESKSMVWIHFSANFREAEGSLILIDGIMTDITIQKNNERELILARNKSEAANHAKSIFLASMSHELRTPLNAILGFSQILSQSDNIPAKEKEFVNIISSSGDYLLRLINQILDLSKIEAGEMVFNARDCLLYNLVDEVYNMFRYKAIDKNIELNYVLHKNVPYLISTDEIKLRQILINLIGNAIKFTNEGSISISVKLLETIYKENDEFCVLEFSVKDTGVGISETDMKNLFKSFQQTDSGKQTMDSTGLGLTITKKFVELLGGDIVASSELGKGSEFIFTIQAKVLKSTSDNVLNSSFVGQKIIGLEEGQKIPKILIVDDNRLNRRLLKHILRPIGLVLEEAVDGIDAIEKTISFQPDLIFMDIRMPNKDGREATLEIRQMGWEIPPKLIALTASVFEEEKQFFLQSGFDDFLIKPFEVNSIFECIQKHLAIKFLYEGKPIKQSSSKNEADPLLNHLPFSTEWILKFRNSLLLGNYLASDKLLVEVEKEAPDIVILIRKALQQFDGNKILQAVESQLSKK